jgi:hypothetical protein
MDVAQNLHDISDKALLDIQGINTKDDKELQFTINDIVSVAFLGKYYAYKISGSTYVSLYRATKDKKYQQLAIKELTNALSFWKKYTQQALEQNHNPLWTNRVGIVDWIQITEWVEQDIDIAKTEI